MDIEVIKLLLQHGAKVNTLDRNGNTILMNMANTTNYDCIKLLLEYGADPHIKNNDGHDAFFYARHKKKNLDLLNQYSQNNDENDNETKFIREGKEFIGTFLDVSENPECILTPINKS